MSDWYELSESFLRSSAARRIGFKSQRWISVRDDCINSTKSSPAPPNTLASVLQNGFVTTVLENGMPCLFRSADESVYVLDETAEQFVPSSIKYDRCCATKWGCVAPCFPDIVPPSSDPTIISVATYSVGDGEIAYERITEKDIPEFRRMVYPDDCYGFAEDAPFFNKTLSHPIAQGELRSWQTFDEVFPDEDIPPHEVHESADSQTGRVIISYRHQGYGKDRITYEDWIGSCASVEKVMQAYGWQTARFWTDARLRCCQKSMTIPESVAWTELGLEPYKLGPVVLLNHSRLPVITDRFWLTVERKTGSHYYGTWLTDDCGDIFYYRLESNSELYSRAIVTSVSTSQGITWASDRSEGVRHEWEQLGVDDSSRAVEMLREAVTFQARDDFVDDDIDAIVIAAKGTTVGWCGDVEGLVDPPCLIETFGCVGPISHETPVQIIVTCREVQETRVTVVVFVMKVRRRSVYVAKRLYIDGDGEIRARSVPRLVDWDYGPTLSETANSRAITTDEERPSWLVGSAPFARYGQIKKAQCCSVT